MKVSQKEAVALGLSGEMMRLSEVKPNPDNPRVMKDDKFAKLCKSIDEFPKMMALRPMVVDADGVVLGGNMRLRALQHLGYTSIPVEWVRKADTLTEDETKRFIIEDNVSFGEWDYDALANEWTDEPLGDWGLDVWEDTEAQQSDEDDEMINPYSQSVSTPIYEIKGECPTESEIIDKGKVQELLAEIDASEIPDVVKDMLRVCAYRHAVINFSKMAEYYAHASKEIQELMEHNALVIIDFRGGVRNGFVKALHNLEEIYKLNGVKNDGGEVQ